MPEILVLDQNTIDKIAAGEVVEKPYSVVKELVENAIDAKASAITIEIKDGGCSLIRITDNGCGIEKDQIELAFLRHSTSKIRKVEDLASISSLGFRGEALSSISAVAQVELITKTVNSFVGSRFEIHGGRKISFEEIGAPEGTTFIVRNLFYNTPARKKFLKTATTEGNYIQNLVERLALSHPEISFKFINNNHMKLHTSGNCNLKDIIYQLYGRDVAANLIEISFESDEAKVKGFIGKPIISRGNRQYENYFVNGRYVKSNLISKAIEQGYKNFLMQHKYPFTVLLAEFDGKSIDVNVHPTKMELRFSEEEKVFQLFYQVVYGALSKKELISSEKLETKKETGKEIEKKPNLNAANKNWSFSDVKMQSVKAFRPAEPFEKKRFEQEQKEQAQKTKEEMSYISEAEEKKPLLREKTSYNISYKTKDEQNEQEQNKQEQSEHEQNKHVQNEHVQQMSMFEEELVDKSIRDEIKIVGQVFDTYWIIEYDNQMYIIDQHAAHEKVLYERMIKLLSKKEFTSQMLNPPMVITVSAVERQILEEYSEQFEMVGYEIEPFGGKEFAIKAIPGNLYGLNERDIFLEMLDDLASDAGKITPDTIFDKIATMSCKAAVKGNMKLSFAEAKELLLELMELENPYHCPHGRPVIFSISRKDIEKKFKRIV